jgi:hypothetical protein
VSETGSVKFTCQQVPVEIGAFAGFAELNEYRRKLRELGLIGVDGRGQRARSIRRVIRD